MKNAIDLILSAIEEMENAMQHIDEEDPSMFAEAHLDIAKQMLEKAKEEIEKEK